MHCVVLQNPMILALEGRSVVSDHSPSFTGKYHETKKSGKTIMENNIKSTVEELTHPQDRTYVYLKTGGYSWKAKN